MTAVALSAGAVLAFGDLPQQAAQGLGVAAERAERDVAARPDSVPTPADDHASAGADEQLDVAAEDLPDAASHGADISAVATGEDPTTETNRGADVSAVARDNHRQATAAEHRPAEVGKPADAPPIDTGVADGAGKPDGAGQPAEPGQPSDPGAPDGAGKPEGVPPQH